MPAKSYSTRSHSRKIAKTTSHIEDSVLDEFLLEVPEEIQPPTPKKLKKDVVREEPKVEIETLPEADFEFECEIPSNDIDCERFYWYDLHEMRDIVYFFGRIQDKTSKKFVSCCVAVKNVQRTIYVLIKEGHTYEKALQELQHIFLRFKIKNPSCEKVTKKHAFNPDVPNVATYVKVSYPYEQPALPSSGENYSHVLNTNQSAMEKLVLELRLKGPCWLKLVNPTKPSVQSTWSHTELVLESPNNLIVEETDQSPPYFCALSISLRTYPNPTTHYNEIIAIACMVNTSFNLDQCLKRTNKASGHFMIMTKPATSHKELRLPYDYNVMAKKYSKTKLHLTDCERDLLSEFMDKFASLDPDIVVGHDLMNFDYETLVMRMKHTKVGAWSKLGRFRRTELPATKAAFRSMFAGRVMCDIRTSAMELIRARSYDLTELASQVLNKTRTEYNHDEIVSAYRSSESLKNMLDATWDDNDIIFSIFVELNIMPLALGITRICGNILSRTLNAGRSERNEYLLLHAFHEDNFICPEKQRFNKFNKKPDKNGADDEDKEDPQAPTRRKAAYAGGLVLEPKGGFYDTAILLMDFNSLYPSIIQEFNICFSTVAQPKLPDGEEVSAGAEIIATVPDETESAGILPAQLKSLVDRRRRVKRLLADAKTPEQKIMLDIEQKALKLTANSMYGCLGFEQSRFYAKHLASLVTFKGREILMSTKAMVEKLGYEVIYGDTDSLMINTKIVDYDDVIQRGNAIKEEINRTFKLLEIDIDGVYLPLLLLKKKNYAGTAIKKLADGQIVRTIETKGLDTVRRDRAVLAKEAGERVLSMILTSGKEVDQIVEDIHNYLKNLGNEVRSDMLPVDKYLISKQLNRNPDEYRATKGIGHVTLALRHNQDTRKTRKLKAGDTVEYVICVDGTSESANQRCYTMQELAEHPDKLKIDYEYYLCQQIHPVMARICDKLPITNAYVLAEMLGIEKSNMLHIRRDQDTDQALKRDQLISKGEARYNACSPLVIHCPNCNLPEEFRSRTRKSKTGNLPELSLSSCAQCGVRYAMNSQYVTAQVIALVKKLTCELYSGKFVCENKECEHTTRNVFCRLTGDDLDIGASGGVPSSDTNMNAQAGTAASSSSRVDPICDLCESPMMQEMDDRQMDIQLNFIKYLFDINRLNFTKDNSPSSSTMKDQIEYPSDDTRDMYLQCWREADHALRASALNNIDAYSIFSMICSGRTKHSVK